MPTPSEGSSDRLPAELKESYSATFDALDADGSDNVSLKELKEAILGDGSDLTEEDVAGTFDACDKDDSGTITKAEFLDFMYVCFMKARMSHSECLSYVDEDGDKLIEREELDKFIEEQNIQHITTDKILKDLGAEEEGHVTLQQFTDYLLFPPAEK